MDGFTEQPRWLVLARALQAQAQTGLVYCQDEHDRERYEEIAAIAAEMMAEGFGVAPEAANTLLDFNTGYATPKVGVRGAIFDDDGRVLLTREREDGLWSLPGGWCEVNQSAAEAVEREIREETGLIARPVKLAALYDHSRRHPPHIYHHYVAFFLCRLEGGAITQSVETDRTGFFAQDDLPPLSLPRVVPDEVAEMFRHHREPGRAAVFD